jgi:thiamine pyrophosphate-dependent acetolactate synthase large subunit-like protein
MPGVPGYRLLIESLHRAGTDVLFFLEGGPLLEAAGVAGELGIRCIDVRHEQAAAMAAQAWSRLTHRIGVCMAASGPATCNLVTGVANAFIDRIPMVVIGGAVSTGTYGRGEFQDIDQVRMMEPVAKAAIRLYSTERIPEQVQTAFLLALSGQPGPVYLDVPADVLFREVPAEKVQWPAFDLTISHNPPDPARLDAALALLRAAKRPIVLSGTGALLSSANDALQRFLDSTGVPLFTTPQGRGVVSEADGHSPLAARTRAFKEADLVLAVGTRLNYIFGFAQPPRFATGLKIIHVDIDPVELTRHPAVAVRLQGDAAAVVGELNKALNGLPNADKAWFDGLREEDHRKQESARKKQLALSQAPIHPLRLCAEIAEFLPEDAILAVDGHVILNFARQSIPTFRAGHRLNSGPFGCLGVGVPFGLGAKVACPDKPVLVLTGDGSFGFNAMELDTAVRHKLPIVVVISNNGGWAAANDSGRPGRDLGFTRYDEMFAPLGLHTEHVTDPSDIRPALERAFAAGGPALINVITDPKIDAATVSFATYGAI